MVLGIDLPLLQYPKIRASQLEGQYYVWLRQYLAKIDGSLEIAGISTLDLERKNDWRLMEAACASDFTDAQVRTIYYCMHYLQVKTVSDICSASRKYILKSLLVGAQTATL